MAINDTLATSNSQDGSEPDVTSKISKKHRKKQQQRGQKKNGSNGSVNGNGKKKKLSKSKMKEIARREAVKNAFISFFQQMYVPERWESSLLPALQGTTRYCCLVNKHANEEEAMEKLANVQDKLQRIEWLTNINCYVVDSDEVILSQPDAALNGNNTKKTLPFPAPEYDSNRVKSHYLLDAASVLATEALSVQPRDSVLDLCAAPGGKSLSILQRLGPYGHLHANEISQERKKRLRKVLKEYLSEELYEQCVDVTGFDATRMRLDLEGQYDKVLCDVPCSSERHLLHDVEEFARWTPNRTKTIAKRQLLILLQAIQAAKKDGGGRIVYATCSISNVENDQVIEKALKKSRYECKVVTHQLREWPIGEATQHGWIVLPDTCGRWGPLFFCVLEKQGLKEKYLDLSSSDEEEEYDEDTDGHEEEDY